MSSMTLEESLERAQTAFRIGEYSLSKRLLERLMLKVHDNPVIFNLLGSIYEREGNYPEAIALFEKAIQLRDDNIEAYNNLGVAYKNKGDVEKALATFTRVLKINPRRADVYYNLGNLYKDINLHKNAIEYYQKAIEIDPHYILAYNNLGTVLEKTGKFDEALEIYHKGLQIDVNNPRLHYNAGVINKKKNRLKEAEHEFRLSLKNSPGFVPAKNNLALILQERHEYERALTLFKDILKTDPHNAEVFNNIGVILAEQNIIDEARSFYEAALKVNPRYKKARFNLARLAEESGSEEEALRELSSLLKHDPEHIDAHLHAGNILIEQNNFHEAEKHFKKILSLQPRHCGALRSLGLFHLKRNDISRALHIMDEIQSIDPSELDFHLDLAFYYKEKMDFVKAQTETERYLSQHPRHIQASVLLADLLITQKKQDQAVKILLNVLEAGKREPEILLMLARVYKEKGQQEEVIELFDEIITRQGLSDELKENKSLGQTLKQYEETITEYEEQFRDQWEKNLRLYKEISTAPAKENIPAGDAFLFEKELPFEEETVPIINIGGIEPVFEINEEEQVLKIEDEIIEQDKNRVIEIEEEGAPTLMTLLEGQELYEESPHRERERPRLRRTRPDELYNPEDLEQEQPFFPPPKTVPEKKVKIEETVKAELDAKVLNELGAKLSQAISSLGEVMKNSMLSSALLAQQMKLQSQVPPVVMFTQPLMTKSTEYEKAKEEPETRPEDLTPAVEGVPRYLDEEEELPALLPQEQEAQTSEETTFLEEQAEDLGEESFEEMPTKEPENLTESPKQEEEILIEGEPEDQKNQSQTSRQELKSFVDTVRQNLDELPSEKAPGFRDKPHRLLDYLSNIANYLPQEARFNAIETEMQIKVESLRNRLSGKTGLYERIERDFRPPDFLDANGITQEKLASTFAFIKELSQFVPDQRMSVLMREKIDAILCKIRGGNAQ